MRLPRWVPYALIALALLGLGARADETQLGSTRFIYVSGIAVSLGDGSPEHPFQTIGEALAVAKAGDSIRVAGGPDVTYRETIEVREPITLQGGYDPLTWERNPEATDTVIDGNGDGPVVTIGPWAGAEGDATFEGFTITNGAGIEGGGLLIQQAWPLVQGNRIIGNYALEGGGGILVDGGAPVLRDNELEGNRAYGVGGGAILSRNSQLVLTGNRILGNYADRGTGGGVSIVGGSAKIEQGLMVANSAKLGAGLSASAGAEVELLNTVAALNTSAEEGSGLAVEGASMKLINASLLYNTSLAGGAGVAGLDTQAVISATNSLFWGHGGADLSGQDISLRYCDVEQGLFAGEGNVAMDPMLGAVQSLDFRLQPTSPLIDAGSNQVPGTSDFEGDWRFYDGDDDGKPRADIGADEVAPNLSSSGLALGAGSWPVPGGAVRYVISLANQGQIDAPAVVVTDVLPIEVVYRAGTAQCTAGGTSVEGRRLIWHGRLDKGSTVRIELMADIAAGVEPGTLVTNQAQVDYRAGRPLMLSRSFVANEPRQTWLPVLGNVPSSGQHDTPNTVSDGP